MLEPLHLMLWHWQTSIVCLQSKFMKYSKSRLRLMVKSHLGYSTHFWSKHQHSLDPLIFLTQYDPFVCTFSGNPATVRFWQESKLGKDSLKPSDATAKTVETTVYVLLNTLVRGDTTYAKPILNWLTQDQRYGGGVHSTQVLQCKLACILCFFKPVICFLCKQLWSVFP